MIIKVPYTGTVLKSNARGDIIKGDPDNPVRPVDFQDLLPTEYRQFSWKVVRYDVNEGIVYLDVQAETQRIPTGETDPNGDPITRKETENEFTIRKVNTEKALDDMVKKKGTELAALKSKPYKKEVAIG